MHTINSTSIRSGRYAGLLLMTAALHVGMAHCRDVVYATNGRISGLVQSVSDDGTVVVRPELLPDPLTIPADLVTRIDFNTDAKPLPAAPGRLTLANGDSLAITDWQWTQDGLEVQSPGLGPLRLARDSLKKLETGHQMPTKTLMTPSATLQGWRRPLLKGEEMGMPLAKEPSRRRLILKGGPMARLQTGFAEPFAVRFAYESNMNPALTLQFPLNTGGEENMQPPLHQIDFRNRKVLVNGFAEGSQGHDIPELTHASRLTVGLQIDPSSGLLRFSINGKQRFEAMMIKRNSGPFGGFQFWAQAGENSSQFIDDFIIESWDAEGERLRHLQPPRLDRDTIVGRTSGTLTGHLVAKRPQRKGDWLELDEDNGKSARRIPLADIMAIHFASGGDAQSDAPFQCGIRSGGSLTASNFVIRDNHVEMVHPLLGELKIARDQLAGFTRIPQPEK